MRISDWRSDVVSSDLNFMSDEWARFLHQVGVPLPGSPGGAAKTQVTTYTLAVFNAQQDANQSALLFNIARVGGGNYFQAQNEDAIVDALQRSAERRVGTARVRTWRFRWVPKPE